MQIFSEVIGIHKHNADDSRKAAWSGNRHMQPVFFILITQTTLLKHHNGVLFFIGKHEVAEKKMQHRIGVVIVMRVYIILGCVVCVCLTLLWACICFPYNTHMHMLLF